MIRPFAISDLDTLLSIERESFPKSPYDWATFVHLCRLYPETFLVYADTGKEGSIVGYIVFSPEGHIISIAVHPQQRRKGIGKELMKRALHSYRFKKVRAEVRRGNRGALAFYSRMGFKTVGTVPGYYGNEDALLIQWASPRR